MNERILPSRKLHVILAVAVVVLLAASLGVRLAATSDRDSARAVALTETESLAASVPPPRPFDVAELEIPHWSHNKAREWPVQFKTDLDLLAPLGTGQRNAGEWFVDFRKVGGPRLDEAKAMLERRVDRGEKFGSVLPADDPLLLEAEPWADQATMHFYPDLLEPNGWNTAITNLLVPLNLARSWVARGVEAADPEAGLEDCRRAIRLGRLLRQEDVVIITDLVGLACIRMGAQGIYDIAIREGDLDLAVLASIVIGEVAPQRLLSSERVTRSWDVGSLREGLSGELVLDVADQELESTLEMAAGSVDRRFQAEAILALNVVRFMGTDEQQARVVELLEELRESNNAMIAKTARWSLEVEPTREQVESLK
jgi:hypothetical protein